MTLDIFEETASPAVDAQKRVEVVQAELVDLEARIATLIYEQSAASEAAQGFYRKQVTNLASRVEILHAQLIQLERKAASVTHESAVSVATIAEMRELSLEAFWQQSDREINQMLHRLFGSRQLVILDKQIVGVVERRKKKRRTPRGV